jgi:hypothetical protein
MSKIEECNHVNGGSHITSMNMQEASLVSSICALSVIVIKLYECTMVGRAMDVCDYFCISGFAICAVGWVCLD